MLINWIAVGSIATIIVAAATFITAWITSRTIKEMKKQRELSYQPELVLCDNFFSFSSAEKNGADPLTIPIYNIGLGSAKNIVIEMQVENFETFFLKLQELIKEKSNQISLVENESIFSISIIDSDGSEEGYSLTKHSFFDVERKKHIIPEKFESIELPKIYRLCFRLLAKAMAIQGVHSLYISELIEMLDLSIKLSYQDIGNNVRKSFFKISPKEIKFMKTMKSSTITMVFTPTDITM